MYFALYQDDGAAEGAFENKESDWGWFELFASEKNLTIEDWNKVIRETTTGRINPRILAVFSDVDSSFGRPICVIDDIGSLSIKDRITAVSARDRVVKK